MGSMKLDWERLGSAYATARRSMRLSQAEVAERIDVSATVVQSIERGHEYLKPTRTQRAYARLVGWTDSSIEKILAGGDPEMASPEPAPRSETASRTGITTVGPTAVPQPGLPLIVRQELEKGRTVRVTIEWTNEGGRDVRRFVIDQLPDDTDGAPAAGDEA